MTTPITIALISNGLMLTFAVGSLFIILWQDSRREINIYFSLFMFTMLLWSSGSLVSRVAAQVFTDEEFIIWGLRLLEIGFGGTCISVYLLAITITEVRNRLFRSALIGGVGLLLIYQIALALLGIPIRFTVYENGILLHDFGRINGFIYLFFATTTFIIVWRKFSQIRQTSLSVGLMLFSLGQIAALVSPRVRELAVAESIGTMAALIISYSFMRRQVMEPLLGRTKQLEAVRDVGLAITSTLNFQEVLETIAQQAAELIEANASAIYLYKERETPEISELVLEAVHNFPKKFVGAKLHEGQGLVGIVAKEKKGRLLNDYSRFWHGAPDMPLAAETFGAVMCVPLIHRDQVEGVLLVVAERDGRLFDKEDMQLLQLLGPQAAVAISNSQLFEQERALTAQVISARNQLKTVLDSTENPVIAVDRKLNIVFANPALVHLLPALSEHSSETLASRCLLDYVQRDMLPKNLRQFVRTIQETHSFVYEVNIGENDYWCHVAPLTEPNRGWVAVLNDITELKRVDRLKSLIVHMTSHDLKNPLTGIVIHLDLLENAGQKVFNDKMNRYMDTIREQVNRMQRIISGILDLNRLETGAPPLEAFEISEVLERAVEDMESQAQLKGLKLHSEIDDINAAVVGDAQQIGQAIINLIENAIKFTPTGGDIWVQAELDNKSIKICVRDTGIGIPKAVQNRVFDRFFRVNPSATNGSGLGLSLVKAVVDRHKGTIWLHSEENVGSSFYIALPLATKKKPTPLPALIAE